MDMEVLNPVKAITIAGREVKVKEMNWRDGMEFLKRLGGYMGQLATGDDGKVSVDLRKLSELVTGTKELADHLLTRATGLTQEEVDALDCSQALELLDAAVALNVSADLIARGKRVAGRVSGAFGLSNSSGAKTPAT